MGSGCIDPHFLDLGTSWRWVVNFTPRPLHPRGKSPRYPLNRRLGGPQSRSGRFGEEKILCNNNMAILQNTFPSPASSFFGKYAEFELAIVHKHVERRYNFLFYKKINDCGWIWGYAWQLLVMQSILAGIMHRNMLLIYIIFIILFGSSFYLKGFNPPYPTESYCSTEFEKWLYGQI
jgi:hypothetical protein